MEPKSKPEIAEVAEERPLAPGLRQVGDVLTEKIIGAAIEVHRNLGPGLLESAYEECLCYELSQLGLRFKRQERLPISYRGSKLDCGYRMDIVVENTIVVEIKTLEKVLP